LAPPGWCRFLESGDPDVVADRPRRADPPGLASPPERALPADADGGWLFDDRGGRRADLGALRRSLGTQGVVRRPPLCDNPAAAAEPWGARSHNGSRANDRHDRALGRG